MKNTLLVFYSVVFLLLIIIFGKSLDQMMFAWGADEYSHGYLIPLISIWLIWENKATLVKTSSGDWRGIAVILIGLFLGLLGELSSLFTISQYGFIIVLVGVFVSFWGFEGLKRNWFPLAYLVFMIPLPNFLYFNLSSYLQLVSSKIGVAIIRSLDILVHLHGNVIDLGTFQLQVVDACSGLRYLFPLASFGFLCGFFFRAPFWMKLVVFLSTIPITILMNSFRIAMIGVLVEYFGISQAEGFLHDFEGWFIFMGCLAVLMSEMWVLNKLFNKDKRFVEVFVVGLPPQISKQKSEDSQELSLRLPPSFYATSIILILAAISSFFIDRRTEYIPSRQNFINFPLQVAEWKGVEERMEQKYIDTLKFSDYIIANYSKSSDPQPINFYVAYYDTQRQGASVHSPKGCLPGDGWVIEEFGQHVIPELEISKGTTLAVNRVLISKGDAKQLVYYWFQQRGRILTNEFLVKWFIFWDALMKNRTDGALVRLVIPLNKTQSEVTSEKTLTTFVRAISPLLKNFVPN